MSEKCSDFCQDDLADDDIMLLDNGHEVLTDHRLVPTETVESDRYDFINDFFVLPCFPSGVHVGRYSDQPGGDQTQSQSLPG